MKNLFLAVALMGSAVPVAAIEPTNRMNDQESSEVWSVVKGVSKIGLGSVLCLSSFVNGIISAGLWCMNPDGFVDAVVAEARREGIKEEAQVEGALRGGAQAIKRIRLGHTVWTVAQGAGGVSLIKGGIKDIGEN